VDEMKYLSKEINEIENMSLKGYDVNSTSGGSKYRAPLIFCI
jgi:hypothetical protein